MVLTDTHTHLYYETDRQKRDELIKRSLDNKVERLFLPNVNSDSIPLVFDLAEAYPKQCFPMLGLHPCEVKENFSEELMTIESNIQQHTIYAVGEIGIDSYWDKTYFNYQKQAFRTQIQWAKQLDLPIVIHCREAFDEIYYILEEEKDERLRGIFHCFTGTLEQASKVIDLGFYLGIGGVVTYKNAGLDKVVTALPLAHIVLETDAPYLTPVPQRGKPNESAYLNYIAQKVADLHRRPIEEIAVITTANSVKIFGI